MVISNNNDRILWIGSPVQPPDDVLSKIKYKDIKCYQKCIFGSHTLKCNDFVLISNADAKDPDSIEGCDIGRILVFYELLDKFAPIYIDRYRAIVQWYSWPQAVPQRHYDCDDIEVDFDREVIEEYRPYDNDISIETIQNKCNVIEANVTDFAEDILKRKTIKIPTFICRYKYARIKSLFQLLPLNQKLDYTNSKSATKTPKNSDSKNLDRRRKSLTLSNKSERICRNLNNAYENIDCNSSPVTEVLDYSIVEAKESDLRIKLRVSQKLKRHVNEEPMKENLIDYKMNDDDENKEEFDPLSTPKKHKIEVQDSSTPRAKKITSTRRRSILKTPGDLNTTSGDTPKRNVQLSNIVEERFYNKAEAPLTPTSRIKTKSSKVIPNDSEDLTPTKSKKSKININTLTPTLSNRDKSRNRRKSDLQIVRENLHVSAVPDCLPCRETEYENIYNFVEHKITSETGGCMYISGVPGTGKTATVSRVIKALKIKANANEIPNFEFIDINGMRLTEPRQAYVQIFKQLTGKSLSWEQSYSMLEKRFTTPAPRRTTTVLLVDELDILCNRRQDVIYNLLDWPSKSTAKLIVITIANTMDLPERLLLGKVTSRLGLTRLTFQPYTHKQLQEIVTSRLFGSDTFKSDAVQLVARKVAAVSGDARRALDICRRATEIAEEESNSKSVLVNMIHVQKALEEMISSAKVQAIKSCAKHEKFFLQAISTEVIRTGLEEVVFSGVYAQMESIVTFMGYKLPTISQAFQICSRLGAQRLIICEHSRNDIYQKIILNVSIDDIHFALQNSDDR